MMDYAEIFVRLAMATLIGAAIGLNRDLHGKPSGVRTHGIVGLGAALAVIAALAVAPQSDDGATVGRVIQGVITGIGFLGAGVIVRRSEATQIQGLTTAACIWLTACIGVIAGLGAWRPLIVAVPLVFAILIFGGPLEQRLHRRWAQPEDD
jgi:putative Mg2+ transporter-C (MgtC) family protein